MNAQDLREYAAELQRRAAAKRRSIANDGLSCAGAAYEQGCVNVLEAVASELLTSAVHEEALGNISTQGK